MKPYETIVGGSAAVSWQAHERPRLIPDPGKSRSVRLHVGDRVRHLG
jgi:hypothetical protein